MIEQKRGAGALSSEDEKVADLVVSYKLRAAFLDARGAYLKQGAADLTMRRSIPV